MTYTVPKVVIDLRLMDFDQTIGLLICTLISENQGLAKSRSTSNLRKISGPANLDFFFSLSPGFFSGLWYKSSFFLGGNLKKNPGLQDLKFF